MATRATWELDCDKCGRVYACGAHTKSSQTLIRRAARADGWHALETHTRGDDALVRVRAVDASDLAPALAPLIAEVSA